MGLHVPLAGSQIPLAQKGPAVGPALAPQLQTPEVQVSFALQVESVSQMQLAVVEQRGLGCAQAGPPPHLQAPPTQVWPM